MSKRVHVPQFDKKVTFNVPAKYGDTKKYRVDMLVAINNESDPPPANFRSRFILVRNRKSGDIEGIYDR